MSSYVIVWENNTFGHMKVKGHTWPGHVAVNIGETFSLTHGEDLENSYVSWWPPHFRDFDVGSVIKGLFKGPEKGRKSPGIVNDILCEKYLPDHVIQMDSSTGEEALMRAEWQAVFLKEGGSSYTNLRKNCSTVASRVLHAGGYYAYRWSVDCNFSWTPADVKKLALGAGGELMLWKDFLKVLAKSNITPAHFRNPVTKVRVKEARSGRFCTTGAPVKHQKDG